MAPIAGVVESTKLAITELNRTAAVGSDAGANSGRMAEPLQPSSGLHLTCLRSTYERTLEHLHRP